MNVERAERKILMALEDLARARRALMQDDYRRGTRDLSIALKNCSKATRAMVNHSGALTNRRLKYVDPWPSLQPLSALQDKVSRQMKEAGISFESTILVKTGGLGDNIQMTPVAKALKQKYPKRPVIALVEAYADVLQQHPYIDLVIEFGRGINQELAVKSMFGIADSVVDVRYVSRAYGKLPNARYSYDHAEYYRNFPRSNARLQDLKMNVCDMMLTSLGLEKYASSEDVYVTPDYNIERLRQDYVVVQNNTGNLGNLKKWTPEGWAQLVPWLISRNLTPVQLGPLYDPLIHPDVVDLRGKTSPRQAAAYLRLSRGYIGVEGGLFHLSKAVKTPAVVIFASTPMVSLAYKDTYAAGHHRCYPCLWAPGWDHGYCHREVPHCLNLPTFKEVSRLVETMVADRGVSTPNEDA